MKGISINQSGEVHAALVLKKNAKIAKMEMEAAKMLNKDYRMIAVNENYIAIPVNDNFLETISEHKWKDLIEEVVSKVLPYSTKILGSSRRGRQSHLDINPSQRAILETIKILKPYGLEENLIIDRIKKLDQLVCPKKIEVLGDDRTLVISREAFDGEDFDSILTDTTGLGKEKCKEEFWKQVAQINKSRRIVRRGIVDKDSPIRESSYCLVWPHSGIPESTGPGSPSWIRVTEQGIKQSFDMCRVMFSRGNISEKIRFGSLVQKDERVLDLYAGIGYFTLPAVIKGGASHCYACEWNPHAASYLKFNIKDNNIEDRVTVLVGDSRLSVREHNLVNAFDRVSLGLLPSSEGGWRSAIRAIKDSGGWLHIHGNVPIKEVDTWALWTCLRLNQISTEEERPRDWVVLCHNVEKVKNFAPTVAHFVADVYIGKPSGFTGCQKMNGASIGAMIKETFLECPPDIQSPSCALSPDGVLYQEWMRE